MVKMMMKVSQSGVPILSHKQIDEIAEKMISEFRPEALIKPQAIDIEIFAQQYMNLSQRIAYLSNSGVYLGKYCFENTQVATYDPDKDTVIFVPVKANTYLIDECLLEDSQQNRYRFTIGHEAGHGYLHQIYYKRLLRSLQESGNDGSSAVVAARNSQQTEEDWKDPLSAFLCRVDSISDYDDRKTDKKEWTDKDRMEWQANAFASSCLMPASAVAVFISQQDEKNLYGNQKEYEYELIHAASQIFQVSEEAAYYRLQGLGYLDIQRDYHQDFSQEAMYKRFDEINRNADRISANSNFGIGFMDYVDNQFNNEVSMQMRLAEAMFLEPPDNW